MEEYARVACATHRAEHDSDVCCCTKTAAAEAIDELVERRAEVLEELSATELQELYLLELGDAVTVIDDESDDSDGAGIDSVGDSAEDTGFYLTHQPVSIATTTDEAESTRVGRVVMATIKQCWFNARRVVMKLDGTPTPATSKAGSCWTPDSGSNTGGWSATGP